MDPELRDLYERAKASIQRGADPEAVNARLREYGMPSFQALGRAVAASMRPTAEEQVLAEGARTPFRTGALGAAEALASTISQGGTLGTIDNAVAMVDPELGRDMERAFLEDQEEATGWQQAARFGLGMLPAAALPAGMVFRTGGALIPRTLAGAGLAGAEGAIGGYATTDMDASAEDKKLNAAFGGGVAALTGGLFQAAGAPVAAGLRRWLGGGAGTRSAAELAQLTGEAPPPGTPSGLSGRFRANTTIDSSLDQNATRKALEMRRDAVGEQLFGRYQNTRILDADQADLNMLSQDEIVGPLVRSMKSRVGQREVGEAFRWDFNDVQQLWRKLSEQERGYMLDPAAQAQAQAVRNVKQRVQEMLDASTMGRFSEDARTYALAAEAVESYDFGRGLRTVNGRTLDPWESVNSPGEQRALFERARDIYGTRANPAADQALRQGMRQNYIDRATSIEGRGLVERAMSREKGDQEMMRGLFDAGPEGDKQWRQWLRFNRREATVDRLTGEAERLQAITQRVGATRSLPGN